MRLSTSATFRASLGSAMGLFAVAYVAALALHALGVVGLGGGVARCGRGAGGRAMVTYSRPTGFLIEVRGRSITWSTARANVMVRLGRRRPG